MTSWQFLRDYMLMDIDYRPQDFMHLTQRQLGNTVTEELSIKSRNNSKWHWTFGAFGSLSVVEDDGSCLFRPRHEQLPV